MNIKTIFNLSISGTFLISFTLHGNGYSLSYQVKGLGDGHEIVSPKAMSIKSGKKAVFIIKNKNNYTISKLVSGNCPAGK